MGPGRVKGDVSQSARSRAPMGVQVRSITWSSEPSRLPSRKVRESSRLRLVISSSVRTSARRYGVSRVRWPSDDFCVSRR